MNIKKNFIFHQKSKSINNKLSIKDFDFNSHFINGQGNIYNNNTNKTHVLTENIHQDKGYKAEEKKEEQNFVKTIDEMNQNVLDLYYDKNSSFKNKIDDLNLKFYLETEKYLNNSKSNDFERNQKLQANLFIILFQQINVFIEEIERLNKIILDNKYKKETILQRTNEINAKKQNILLKDNLIQSLKKSNTNTEKKLLETLLHEDKLIKDNERLRKENETYKTLTIVFENELKNNIKKNGLTPQKNKVARHIKTYSDYGVPSNSIINELCGQKYQNEFEENNDTINEDNKFTSRDNKKSLYNPKIINKGAYNTNKNNYSINMDIKSKKKKLNKIVKCNKIVKNPMLTENNSKNKKKIIKFSLNNNKQKSIQNRDNKSKKKIDNSNLNKKENNNITNNNNNLCYSFVYTNKNPFNSNKNNKTNASNNNNGLNLDTISNNINSTINTNTNTNNMTETNNFSFEKSKDKNFKKIDTQQKGYYHKKQKTMSEISFNEIVRVEINNNGLNDTTTNKNSNNNKSKNRKSDININQKKSPSNKKSQKNNTKKSV